MKFGAKSGLGKAAAALCAGLCCTVMASAQAQSDQPNGQQQRKEGRRDFRDMRDARDSRWGDARDPRSFEARAEDQRRMMEENNSNAEASRRMGRMTADERRDLRRQINEAGQQVYSLPPRR